MHLRWIKDKIFSSPTGENNLGERPQKVLWLVLFLKAETTFTTLPPSISYLMLLYTFPCLFQINRHAPKDLV